MRWKRGIGGLVLVGAVVAGALSGPGAATASADRGLVLTPEAGSSPVANDGCTFSSVGGSCSDPGPVGGAWIAFVQWFRSVTGSSESAF